MAKSRKPASAPVQITAPAPSAVGRKTVCPVSRETFLTKAPRGLAVKIGESVLAAVIKEFSTGSLGWYASGKVTVMVDGVPASAQVGLNVTLVGSKELPQ